MAYTKKVIERIPFVMKFPASEAQLAIREEFTTTHNNIFCKAVAGSGKTTTIAYLMTFWKEGGAYIAFNKNIVGEMESKCPPQIQVKTRHAFGMQAVRHATGSVKVVKSKVMDIISEFGYVYNKADPDSYDRIANVVRLVDQMRNNLISWDDSDGIDRMIAFYAIDIDDVSKLKGKLPDIFKKMIDVSLSGIIDFADMKWMPVHMDWNLTQFPCLFIDEAQDSSLLDIAFDKKMLRPDGKIVIVGDARQSIYGFAGANSNSIEILSDSYDATEMPLTVTFRCAQSITEKAKKIVDYIEAWEKSPEGIVKDIHGFNPTEVDPYAMVLCRRNAPLVGPCFAALKAGIKANIKGRDIGAGLISTITKLRADHDMTRMLDKLGESTEIQRNKIMARSKPSPMAIEMLEDQQAIIEAFAMQDNVTNVADLKSHIKSMFTESDAGMMFSSVHKSKGLESDTVVLLDYPRIRLGYEKMTQEAMIQESNLEYVAITRAKSTLLLDRGSK